MQTYYDYTLRKWVTRQADGSVRDATNAEALDAYSRGAQAPAGTPGPGSTSPTPALNPVPQTTDTFTGQMGAPPVPPAPAAPDPYQGWLGSDPNSRSYRYFTPDLNQYYEKHPDEAYRQYVGAEFGDRQTPLSDYARGHYNDYWAQYIQASEADPTGGAGWTNALTTGLADKIRQGFTLQSPTQKGYSLMFQPGGRIT